MKLDEMYSINWQEESTGVSAGSNAAVRADTRVSSTRDGLRGKKRREPNVIGEEPAVIGGAEPGKEVLIGKK